MDDFATPPSFSDSFLLNEDLGRESLGIFDFNNGGSWDFMPEEFGRESLGIVDLTGLDLGRESLGITNIKTYDFVVSNVNLPQIPEENLSEDSDEFKDAIFIEANHIAERISDGSIYWAEDTLDSIQEPGNLADSSAEEAAPKRDPVTVFKSIDKLFGSSDKDQNVSKTGPSKNGPPETSPTSKLPDLTQIIEDFTKFMNDITNEEKRSQGLSLLTSLKDILLSRSKQATPPQPVSKSNSKILNCTPRRATITLNRTAKANNRTAGNSGSSNDNSRSAKKFKVRRSAEPTRGPLRAVLPVSDMAKENGGGLKVPPRRTQRAAEPSKEKKSSTPIMESTKKPPVMASCQLSPIARPSLPGISSPRMYKRRSAPLQGQSTTTVANGRIPLLKRGSTDGVLKENRNRSGVRLSDFRKRGKENMV